MMTSSVQWRCKRILAVIDTASQGAPVAHTAAVLAAEFNVPLHGLFVENINLLRLAALPFAREIGFSSAAERPLLGADLARFFRRESMLAERLLSEAAERLQVPWSFQIAQGLPVATPFELAEATDLLVLGKSRLTRRGPVLTIFDKTAAATSALQVAAQLADISASDLVVLLPTQEAAALRESAASLVSGFGGKLVFHHLPQLQLSDLANLADKYKATALVLPGEAGNFRNKEMHVLLDKLDCPLILVI